MKTKLSAFASALPLALLMSTAWGAAVLGPLLKTGLVQVTPIVATGGTPFQCPSNSTKFENVFSTLTVGEPDLIHPGNTATFSVPGSSSNSGSSFDVKVAIKVLSGESFDFTVTGGWIHKIQVKAGLNEDTYNYELFKDAGADDDFLGKVSKDTGLNKRTTKSQKVSHLDLCLSAQELPPNTSLLGNCLELQDGPSGGGTVGGGFSPGGCYPAGPFQQTEFPDEVAQTTGTGIYAFAKLQVTQKLVPALTTPPGAQTAACGGLSGQYPFVAQDPRVDAVGNFIPAMKGQQLDLSTVFDLTPFFPSPDSPAGKVVLRADTVGSPCLALIHGQNTFGFENLILPAGVVYGDGPVAAITQSPEDVPGMNAGAPRITFPLGPDSPAQPGQDHQPDHQFVEQATHQPDNRFLLVEDAASPFTYDAWGHTATKKSVGSYYVLNTREACLSLNPAPVPPTTAYYAAVQQCKINLAVEYFNNLEVALREAAQYNSMINPGLSSYLNKHSIALSMIKTRQWTKAITRIGDLRTLVLTGQWKPQDVRNDQGTMIMRIDNLLWRTKQLQQAEAMHGL